MYQIYLVRAIRSICTLHLQRGKDRKLFALQAKRTYFFVDCFILKSPPPFAKRGTVNNTSNQWPYGLKSLSLGLINYHKLRNRPSCQFCRYSPIYHAANVSPCPLLFALMPNRPQMALLDQTAD